MAQGINSIGTSLPPSPILKTRKEGLNQGTRASNAPMSPSHQVPIVDKSKVDPKVVEAAEGMEAMFIDYMMKVMRETVPKNDFDLESPATAIYRGMQDSEYAQKAARQGGIGLADQIIASLGASGYNITEGHGVPIKEKP